MGAPEVYGEDRLFVYLRLEDDGTHDAAVRAAAPGRPPVVRLYLKDRYDLGAQFFLWEMATAVAGSAAGASTPLTSPNVEAAKVLARQMVSRVPGTKRCPSRPRAYGGRHHAVDDLEPAAA